MTEQRPKVAHLTTVDLSLRYLILPQLLAVRDIGGEALGISAPGTYVEELELEGIRHVPLASSTRKMSLRADLRSVWDLWSILRRERPDVLHTHNPKPGLYGRIVGRLAGVPIVVNTVHGLFATPDDPLLKRVLVYSLEAVASRFSDVELIQSREDYELLIRRRLSSPHKTHLLGNGVDLERFDPSGVSEEKRSALRQELGSDDGTVVVGMVGRLVAEKGYLDLFEAARQLGEGYLVVCIGPDDPDKADAVPRRLVQEAERQGVRFLGMRTDMELLYRAMDLFVLPSHREGFPRAAMEGAAMGLPIIATDIRGCREVVDDDVNGLLFPVGDVAALTKAIQEIASNPRLRQRMSVAAREKAKACFDERRVVEIVMDSYRKAAAGKGLPWPAAASGEAEIRPASTVEAPVLARLHREAIATGFLPQLGHRFLTILYRALINWQEAVVLVADHGVVVGFVAGVTHTGRFYRHFVRRYGLQALWAALPRLVRPRVVRRAWETWRYGSEGTIEAELLSTATAASAQRKGIGKRLGQEFLAVMAAQSVPAVKVVLGSDNQAARALYEALGFVETRRTEVHPEEESLEMVWSSSQS